MNSSQHYYPENISSPTIILLCFSRLPNLPVLQIPAHISSTHHSVWLCQLKRAPGRMQCLGFTAAQHTAVFAQAFKESTHTWSLQRHRTQRSPQPVLSTSCRMLPCVCHHPYSSLVLVWTEIPDSCML